MVKGEFKADIRFDGTTYPYTTLDPEVFHKVICFLNIKAQQVRKMDAAVCFPFSFIKNKHILASSAFVIRPLPQTLGTCPLDLAGLSSALWYSRLGQRYATNEITASIGVMASASWVTHIAYQVQRIRNLKKIVCYLAVNKLGLVNYIADLRRFSGFAAISRLERGHH